MKVTKNRPGILMFQLKNVFLSLNKIYLISNIFYVIEFGMFCFIQKQRVMVIMELRLEIKFLICRAIIPCITCKVLLFMSLHRSFRLLTWISLLPVPI